jgi:hypothetical protein
MYDRRNRRRLDMSDSLSSVRHGIRGCLNSIKLCTSALELQCTLEEQIEFIDDIITSAGSMSGLLDRLESLPQCDPPSERSDPT